MKLICIFIHLFLSKPIVDSVNLRIYNNSPYYILKYRLIINHCDFSYDSIPPHSFSIYKKEPYVFDENESECTYIFKPFLSRPRKLVLHTIPMDHNGDRKLENGNAILSLEIIKRNKEVNLFTSLKKE